MKYYTFELVYQRRRIQTLSACLNINFIDSLTTVYTT